MSVFFGWLLWGLYTLWAIWNLVSLFLQNPHGGIKDKVSQMLMNWNSLLIGIAILAISPLSLFFGWNKFHLLWVLAVLVLLSTLNVMVIGRFERFRRYGSETEEGEE